MAVVNRSTWIKEKRRVSMQRMDTEWSSIYDENWGRISQLHQQMFGRFLRGCPEHALILDAACGTGKYWPMILASGRRVFGIDQSLGMLSRARTKFPMVPTEQVGLQEMAFQAQFDAATCIDAMESVFPEDWPLVLKNIQRALKPGSLFYFTVELMAEQEIVEAFATAQQEGMPVVYGEWTLENKYHYYPKIEQAKVWIEQAGFQLAEEAAGDEYHHFIVMKA